MEGSGLRSVAWRTKSEHTRTTSRKGCGSSRTTNNTLKGVVWCDRKDCTKYINTLIEENEKAKLWIGNLMKESQAQEEVLRQHNMGQPVLAKIKQLMNQQGQHKSQPHNVNRSLELDQLGLR